MAVWAVLLRGINVGGHNKVPMAELRAALTEGGFDDVATYIASGNVVLRADACEPDQVSGIIAERFGLDIAVVVRTGVQLRAAVAANPFPEAADQPKSLSCFFTSEPVDEGALAELDHERYAPDLLVAAAGELYAFYPEGMARSKLTNSVIDRVAGGPTTARNWNTVLKLVGMVTAAEADGDAERRG